MSMLREEKWRLEAEYKGENHSKSNQTRNLPQVGVDCGPSAEEEEGLNSVLLRDKRKNVKDLRPALTELQFS